MAEDVVTALNLGMTPGHWPLWIHAKDHGALALMCQSDGCSFEVRPRVTYLAAHGAVAAGGSIGSLVDPHLEEFRAWHREHTS